ncbi:PTS sugar transporter subunit IIA [Buttiauxella sp.]|uniref:PTS sugar transporter subunit IIA n=1 Tax=Buttiauxella sp. TaxID=1972222 RepID=UPI003C756D4D
MVHYILATHGKMAGGMKSSAEMLLGPTNNLSVYDAYVDEEDISVGIQRIIRSIDENQKIVMLSDMRGGSVNQKMMGYLGGDNIFLVTGLNLALLLTLLVDYSDDIDEQKLSKVVEEHRDSMQVESLDFKIEDDFL